MTSSSLRYFLIACLILGYTAARHSKLLLVPTYSFISRKIANLPVIHFILTFGVLCRLAMCCVGIQQGLNFLVAHVKKQIILQEAHERGCFLKGRHRCSIQLQQGLVNCSAQQFSFTTENHLSFLNNGTTCYFRIFSRLQQC